MRPLGSNEVESYQRDGFVIVRGLLAPEEISEIESWVEAIRSQAERSEAMHAYYEAGETGLLRQVENVCPAHRRFQEFATSGEVLGLVSQLLGARAILFKDKVNFKLPGGGGYEVHRDGRFWWHDAAGTPMPGWDAYASDFVSALIGIDRATRENGCLEVAAGRHVPSAMPQAYGPLTEAEALDMVFTPCPTEPGDVVFFNALAPHRSGPNRTDRPRRALYLTYSPAADGDQRERYFADKRASMKRQGIEREQGR